MGFWKGMGRSRRVIATAVLSLTASLLAILGLANLLPYDEVTAAWVQAVGTIWAIVIAVVVVEYESALNAESGELERKLKAQSLAILLYPELLELRAKLRANSKKFAIEHRRLTQIGQGTTSISAQYFALQIPPLFLETWRDFSYFNQATMASVNQLLSTCLQYTRINEEAFGPNKRVNAQNVALILSRIQNARRHVIMCRKVAKVAMELVGKVHDTAIK